MKCWDCVSERVSADCIARCVVAMGEGGRVWDCVGLGWDGMAVVYV